jgi:uncharacterized protein DUF222
MDTHAPQDLDRLGDQIAELSAHLDAATARLLDLIREFDARAGWNTGFRSCADWLSWRVGLNLGAARERVRVARALGTLPLLAGALTRGELSYAKVRALTRVAAPETEERLLVLGRAGTAQRVERIVRGWRLVDSLAEAREADRQQRRRELCLFEDEDGMVVVRGRLTPEVGALLRRALEAARETLYQRERHEAHSQSGERALDPPTASQQRADALVLVAESALHSASIRGRRASGIRSWFTSMPTYWLEATLANPSWRTEGAFPRKRRDDSPVTRPAQQCDMMPPDVSSRWPAGRGPSPRRCAGLSNTETMAVDFRAVGCVWLRDITFGIGLGVDRQRSPTSLCFAAVTIARCTRRDTRSNVGLTELSGSAGPTASRWPRCPIRARCPSIRRSRSEQTMWPVG